ncbi:MAG: LLM class flavin-dependent oxidoreductase [Acidimicrobiia bacterium]
MRVGLNISGSHPFELAHRGQALAGRLGADSVWLADHMLGLFHPELWPEMELGRTGADPDGYLDPWCVLAALAPASPVPLGMCVTDATRRGAADVARTALTLQQLAEPGFVLGVGAGEAENLLPFGYPFDAPVARTRDFLAELRELLDTGRMPGTVGRLGVPLETAAGRPQVWVAGHGPRMLELTGTYADGWLPAWSMAPEDYAERRALVAAHAAAAGRPAPVSAMYVVVLMAASRREAAAMFDDEPLAKLFARMGSAEQWRRHGLEHPTGPRARGLVDLVVHELDPAELRRLAPRIPFELIEEIVFVGNRDEVATALEPYATAGLEHVVLADMTGLVGGVPEARRRAGELAGLVQVLRAW